MAKRNYTQDEIQQNIILSYKNARTKLTYDFTKKLEAKYLDFKNSQLEMTMQEAMAKLNNFIDQSDPDITLPNLIHGYQAAEQMRKDGMEDWMQLVGLIHDVGKILYLKGCDEDGTSISNQFAIVGDTFITGCKIPSSIVYDSFSSLNEDHLKYDENGIYSPHCGLDSCTISFGHDEYLYRVLLYNKIELPEAAYDMIRYHSLYLWHTNGEYSHLCDEKDSQRLENVKLFNKYDLYTKENKIEQFDYEYYDNLIEKFFKGKKLIW